MVDENLNEERAKRIKKNRRKFKLYNFLGNLAIWGIIAIFGLALAALIAFEIYLWVTYGGKPLGELPTWVGFLMFRKN